MMGRSGTASANAANSGSCGKYRKVSKDGPRRASTRAPARNAGLASVPGCARLSTAGWGSHITLWRMPRNRLGLAACNASSTAATRSPRLRLACPTMAAAARQGPYRPLALAAASPWTHSTSPTGRSSSGPSGRYIARASRNTVERTLWPQCTSATSSWRR